ncbi:phage primase [Bacillus timonensis]|uniref:phage primase n=1 Tax=Bacillus timonensis TaxID=1033734 RepID=UPI000287E543|nr:phage primase [Bacillus timonensis]
MIDKLRIVKFHDSLYSYDQIHYRNGDYVKRSVAQELEGQKIRYVNEVIRQIEICAPSVEAPPFGWVIKFKNGCLYNGQWLDIDYTDFTPYYIDILYDPEAAPVPVVDEFLRTFTGNDEAYIQFIPEVMAHSLITDIHVKRGKKHTKPF